MWEHKVVYGRTIEELELEVSKLLDKGWMTKGELTVRALSCGNQAFQKLMRYVNV